MAMVMRLAPFFPARILPGTAIRVDRAGGSATVNMDWSGIQQSALPVDPANYEFTLRYSDGSFVRVPVGQIILPVVTWDTLTEKPTTFPPSAHTHPISDIINLQLSLDGKVNTADTIAVNRGGTGQTSYTNGQILIGNTTGNTLAKATLTPAAGVSITNGTGSITIGTVPGQLPGEPSNAAATAGNIGELISSTIASGSAVSLTTGTPANVTSISLTAGDWDVWINARYTGGATTQVTNVLASINDTSATLDTTPGRIGSLFANGNAVFNTSTLDVPVGAARISLASTTTIYFVAQALFTTSTCSAYGVINARRRR